MQNPAKKIALSTQKFVSDHKVALTAVTSSAATAVVVIKLQSRYLAQAQDFLKEHGLYEEFHNRFNNV